MAGAGRAASAPSRSTAACRTPSSSTCRCPASTRSSSRCARTGSNSTLHPHHRPDRASSRPDGGPPSRVRRPAAGSHGRPGHDVVVYTPAAADRPGPRSARTSGGVSRRGETLAPRVLTFDGRRPTRRPRRTRSLDYRLDVTFEHPRAANAARSPASSPPTGTPRRRAPRRHQVAGALLAEPARASGAGGSRSARVRRRDCRRRAAGRPWAPLDGRTGTFVVAPSDKQAPDFRARGTSSTSASATCVSPGTARASSRAASTAPRRCSATRTSTARSSIAARATARPRRTPDQPAVARRRPAPLRAAREGLARRRPDVAGRQGQGAHRRPQLPGEPGRELRVLPDDERQRRRPQRVALDRPLGARSLRLLEARSVGDRLRPHDRSRHPAAHRHAGDRERPPARPRRPRARAQAVLPRAGRALLAPPGHHVEHGRGERAERRRSRRRCAAWLRRCCRTASTSSITTTTGTRRTCARRSTRCSASRRSPARRSRTSTGTTCTRTCATTCGRAPRLGTPGW
jgi:hypothetical protein